MRGPTQGMTRALVWLLLSLSWWCVVPSVADEEDPLQHEAQLAARDRQLTQVLRLLEVENSSVAEGLGDYAAYSDLVKSETLFVGACKHVTLDFTVTGRRDEKFRSGQKAALHVANFLNNLFVTVPEGTDPTYPPHVFYTLLRATMKNEPSIASFAIAFLRNELRASLDRDLFQDRDGDSPASSSSSSSSTWNEAYPKLPASPQQEDPFGDREVFGAYAYRWEGEIGTADLALLYNSSYDQAQEEGTKWFTHFTQRFRSLSRRINGSSINPNNNIPLPMSEGPRTPSVALTRETDGFWTPHPIFDCNASRMWVVAYSLPFFGRHADGVSAKLKGVVLINFPLTLVDLNQCDDAEDLVQHHIFSGTHKCDISTTKCVPVRGTGFRRGGYRCQCHPTHYLPNSTQQFFNGSEVELAYSEKRRIDSFRCQPCPEGCQNCSTLLACSVQYDAMMRLIPVCVEAACVFMCLVLALVIFRLRKCKVIAASLWTMLEMVLLGAIVIYSTVFLRYVEPTVILCMIEPWFREMGFALFYGAIVLKLYRSLVDYRTRKAHRYVIRDRDLLKYLAGLVIFIMGYLAAWSALTAHLATEGHSHLVQGRTKEGLAFSVCKSVWWEYVTEAGELIFIMFGLYLSWHLNKAAGSSGEPSELSERRALSTALILELLTSAILYTGRHLVWLHAHPDHVFLAYFTRMHLTITISLFLIFIPKLWCAGGSAGRDPPRRTYSTTEGCQEPRLCDALTNGDLEASDINLSQMDPEEIRAELKRVYTQLEILRTKTMRKDNPHISKRRGGRKVTHRRFSLQSLHRHYPRPLPHTLESGEGEISKTPEESVCSIEGPSVLSVYTDGPSDIGTPSILHRSYKL
ncbi:metabotropic glycine receptor isoform X2 [Macrobrachium rosenbergii]|uniref:metabotropic glycine receptor isoform X2 n=1 Tax=Macrobrachium rosenbergii TaxID=79674 RepID=UPI0034D7A2D1